MAMPDLAMVPTKRLLSRERLFAEYIADRVGEAVADRIVLPTIEVAPQPAPVAGVAVNIQQLVTVPNGTGLAPSVYTVAGGAALWPLSVMCRLSCSAAVADRTVALEYRTPDGTRYLVAGTQAIIQAGDVYSFCWQPEAGGVIWPVEDVIVAPLPQQHVMPSFQLALKVGNGDVGDVLDQVLLSARFDPLAERD